MNPIHVIVALIIGIVAGAVPAYLIGRGDGKEAAAMNVGALKTSVESCALAAGEAKKAADEAKADGKSREERITAVVEGINTTIAATAARQRAGVLNYKPRGDTECERTVNAVRDNLMGGGNTTNAAPPRNTTGGKP